MSTELYGYYEAKCTEKKDTLAPR